MKWPLKINKRQDLTAVKWAISFGIVYLGLSQVVWNLDRFRLYLLQPYNLFLAWLLDPILTVLGHEVFRDHNMIYVKGSPIVYVMGLWCSGLYGGFFIYISAAGTFPSPSLRTRMKWLIGGALLLALGNLFRIVVLIMVSSRDPGLFDLAHNLSQQFNMVLGCVLTFFALNELMLRRLGVKVFRRREQKAS